MNHFELRTGLHRMPVEIIVSYNAKSTVIKVVMARRC